MSGKLSRRLRRASGAAADPRRTTAEAASLAIVVASGLVDRHWYGAQSGRVFPRAELAAAHYVATGRRAGLSPNPLFEPEWYMPERWAVARADPLAHFVLKGAEAPASHPLFDHRLWSAWHPGSASHRGGALGHVLESARPSTVLPTDPTGPAGGRPLTWGTLQDSLREALDQRRRRAEVAGAPRTRARHDRPTDDAFVARWSRSPLEPRGDQPLVSVVMPVRNRPAAVSAAVASVKAQTLTSWQLVLVDDGSSDGTPAVLASLAGTDPRIDVVTTRHVGIAGARNLGIARARGRYVAFLDSDNSWLPHYLRTAVAAAEVGGDAATYAITRRTRGGQVSYGSLDAQAAHLAVRNHVDLNVLLVRREVLLEVGGFDESLRRTVDYDLVWRLSERGPLRHLPFVGAAYDDDVTAPDRVTVREARAWKDVVRRNHLVDWETGSQARRPGRTSVLVVARDGWHPASRAVTSVLEDADATGEDVEVVVVDAGLRHSVARLLACWASCDERVRVVTAPDAVSDPLGLDLALGSSTGDVVLLLADHAEVGPGVLRDLRRVLDDSSVAGVQPLLLRWDDVVAGAGWWLDGGRATPAPLLAEHPTEDAGLCGPELDVDGLDGRALAMRADLLLRLRGADPLLATTAWDVDLSLRAAAATGGRLVVTTASRVVVGTDVWRRRRPAPVVHMDPKQTALERRLLRERWHGVHRGGRHRDVLAGAGLDIVGARARSEADMPSDVRDLELVVVRRPVSVVEGVPRLRWAIQTATPPGPDGGHWGDRYFAASLAESLRALGQQVVVDNRSSSRRRSAHLDDVVLSLRGRLPLAARSTATNLLWVISHPADVTVEEMMGYDVLLGAGARWVEEAQRRTGRPVGLMHQATDARRFRELDPDPTRRHPVLFVGNTRGAERPVVSAALEVGAPLVVVGKGWEGRLPQGTVRSEHVDNADLPLLYRSAGVLLNDHWDDMREQGFVSNRLFDAVAVGARVLSDHVEGIDELFGGAVRTYRTVDEVRDVLSRGAAAFPPDLERLEIARRVAREHSFDARARELVDLATEARGGGRAPVR